LRKFSLGTYQCSKANYEIILCPNGQPSGGSSGNGGESNINWNEKNWAMSCDFHGNDLSNARVPADRCGGQCDQTPGCTHFTWTTFNGGTCWMKKGLVSKNDAFSTTDPSMVCGIKGSQKRYLSKRIHFYDILRKYLRT
jgi:hypothetical protein